MRNAGKYSHGCSSRCWHYPPGCRSKECKEDHGSLDIRNSVRWRGTCDLEIAESHGLVLCLELLESEDVKSDEIKVLDKGLPFETFGKRADRVCRLEASRDTSDDDARHC